MNPPTTRLFVLLNVYFLIRLISFSTAHYPQIESAIAATFVIFFAVITVRKPFLGLTVLIAEFLLDGNGHFFELFGVALRTWFVYTFLLIWTVGIIRKQKTDIFFQFTRPLLVIFAALDIAFCIGIINGIVQGHSIKTVIQDFIPYTFLLLIFPAKEYLAQLKSESQYYSQLKYLVTAYLAGSVLFSLLTLFLFSTGLSVIQDPYYKWFRDVAGGKITDVGNDFFRIVLPDHLLLVPILLIVLYSIVSDRIQWRTWVLVLFGLIPLTLSVSRTYTIAFVIGMLFLYTRSHWKRWLTTSSIAIVAFIAIFTSIHFIASRGASLGWELYSARFAGVVQPSSEVSSASRKALLTPIFEKIKANPILGSGLGETLTFTDPQTGQLITTSQFDWGYLEVWAELGLLGLIATLSLIAYLVYKSITTYLTVQFTGRYLLLAIIAFAFMQITTQAMFHVFGALFLVATITLLTDAYRKLPVLPLHRVSRSPQ